MGAFSNSIDGVVEEMMRIHRSLPPRPSLDEVEAARVLVRNVEAEEQSRIDAIMKQEKAFEIPDELFFVLQEMQKNFVCFQCVEQKREAVKLLELENTHKLFDELVQRASDCLPSINGAGNSVRAVSGTEIGLSKVTGGAVSSSVVFTDKEVVGSYDRVSRDDSFVKKTKPKMLDDSVIGRGSQSAAKGFVFGLAQSVQVTSGEESGKLTLIKLASLIEVSAKKGTRDLNLQGKLSEQVDWLPDSIGKLTSLITLDLSENRLIAVPGTVGSLSSLTKLDLHANRISQLPDTVGDLLNLLFLDLRGNQLQMLPPTIGKLVKLEELDLSSNLIFALPETIGNLIHLRKLNIETNDIEELPHTIGNCVNIVELLADYNRLKCLPEAIGRLESLQILSLRYNNVKGLPTTMASLSKLKELDVSFNELESVPESLCLATSLVKLNVSNNFADLQSLPRSIGNLELLEELDISNNQIRVLPESFKMLSQLRILRAEENPLEVPPRHIAEMGAQAVVQYMSELSTKKDIKVPPVKNKMSWANLCFLSKPKKRKHNGLDYVN